MSSSSHMGFGYFLKRVAVYLIILFMLWLSAIVVTANSTGRIQEYVRRYTNIPVGTARRGGSSHQRFREIDKYKDLHILFIGSSHCYRGIDTRVFEKYGLYSFNMGSTNQTPINSYYLMQKYLPTLNPKTIVIEVYPEVLGGSGLGSLLDLTENLPTSVELAYMAIAVGRVRSVNALLARHVDFNRPAIDMIKPSPIEGDTYIEGGYVEKSDDFEGGKEVSVHKIIIKEKQIDYLNACIRLAKKHASKVLLIIQPLPDEALAATLNYTEVVKEIKNLATDEAVGFVDFNDFQSVEPGWEFYDSNHLRHKSVELFNTLLYDVLIDSNYVAH